MFDPAMATGVQTAPIGASPRRGVRAEYVLIALFAVALILLPVHIRDAYSGLPAHPLLLHIPVILLPIAIIGAILLAVRPRWFDRWGVTLVAVAVVGFIGLVLTYGAGEELRDALHLNGGGGFGDSALVARHAHAASILRLLTFFFTGVFLVSLGAERVSAGMAFGLAPLDALLARPQLRVLLRVAVVVLAGFTAYFLFHTGDLGAKAVWQDKLGGGGFPGAGFPGGGGAGGGGGAPNLFGGG
jgi:hypothetical protein